MSSKYHTSYLISHISYSTISVRLTLLHSIQCTVSTRDRCDAGARQPTATHRLIVEVKYEYPHIFGDARHGKSGRSTNVAAQSTRPMVAPRITSRRLRCRMPKNSQKSNEAISGSYCAIGISPSEDVAIMLNPTSFTKARKIQLTYILEQFLHNKVIFVLI